MIRVFERRSFPTVLQVRCVIIVARAPILISDDKQIDWHSDTAILNTTGHFDQWNALYCLSHGHTEKCAPVDWLFVKESNRGKEIRNGFTPATVHMSRGINVINTQQVSYLLNTVTKPIGCAIHFVNIGIHIQTWRIMNKKIETFLRIKFSLERYVSSNWYSSIFAYSNLNEFWVFKHVTLVILCKSYIAI